MFVSSQNVAAHRQFHLEYDGDWDWDKFSPVCAGKPSVSVHNFNNQISESFLHVGPVWPFENKEKILMVPP